MQDSVSTGTHAPTRRSVVLLAAVLSLAVFGLDQGIKWYVEDALRVGQSIELVPDFLSITHIQNSGGAFGLLAGRVAVLLAGSAVAVAAVVWMLFSGAPSRLTAVACGLILGGAAGNLLDRLQSGAVTDYVHFSFWYIFNAADAAIVAGVALLLLSSLRPADDGKG
jgi:signal peptidase II